MLITNVSPRHHRIELGVVQCSSLLKGGIQTTQSGQVKVIRGSDLRLANVKERLRRLGLFNLKAKTHGD